MSKFFARPFMLGRVVDWASTAIVAVVFSWSLLAFDAYGATVKFVGKKTLIVTLEDVQPEDGVEMDETICVYDDSNKIVGCGTVTKSKGSTATLRFKGKKSHSRVKKGMTARAKSSGGKTASGKSTRSKKKSPFRIWASYSPAIATPATYNKLAYKLPKDTAPDTVWESNETSSSSFLAFNIQAGIPMGSYSINPGFRFRSYTDSQIDADYNATKKELFARTEQTATAMGFWTDFQYFSMSFSKSLRLDLTSGLDFDMSSVKFKATSMDDTGEIEDETIAEATSSLTVVSVRVGAGMDFMLAKSFGMHAGTTIMIPVTEMSRSVKGSSSDANASAMDDPEGDLTESLGHKKNSFALEASLGLVMAF